MYTIRLPDGREFGPGPMDVVVQWASEGRIPPNALVVDEDGSTRPVADVPELAARVLAPPTISTGVAETGGGAMSGMIPYHNPAALVGYYMAIFSLVPGVGLFLGIPAAVCGVFGLRAVRREPKKRGTAHACVAIILGLLTGIGSWVLLVRILPYL